MIKRFAKLKGNVFEKNIQQCLSDTVEPSADVGSIPNHPPINSFNDDYIVRNLMTNHIRDMTDDEELVFNFVTRKLKKMIEATITNTVISVEPIVQVSTGNIDFEADTFNTVSGIGLLLPRNHCDLLNIDEKVVDSPNPCVVELTLKRTGQDESSSSSSYRKLCTRINLLDGSDNDNNNCGGN